MPQHKLESGYTMLELLIVLVCIIGLAAVMLYSFVTPVGRQVSINAVTSQISELLDAAHLWRHSNRNYNNISISQLERKVFIPQNWDKRALPNRYTINSFTNNDWFQCSHNNSCVLISVSGVPRVCQFIIKLYETNPVVTFPSYNQCKETPNLNNNKKFMVVYD